MNQLVFIRKKLGTVTENRSPDQGVGIFGRNLPYNHSRFLPGKYAIFGVLIHSRGFPLNETRGKAHKNHGHHLSQGEKTNREAAHPGGAGNIKKRQGKKRGFSFRSPAAIPNKRRATEIKSKRGKRPDPKSHAGIERRRSPTAEGDPKK